MKTHAILRIIMAIASSWSCASLAQAAPDDWTVVPGKSVGQIAIGMEHAEVIRLLGAPHRQDDLEYVPGGESNAQFKDTLREDWITPLPVSATPERNAYFMANFVTIYLRERRVVQIEVRVPRFKTDTGLSIASTALQWRQRFPLFTETNQRFHHTSAGGWPAVKHFVVFEDAVDAGVAWRYGGFGNLAPDSDPSATVHVIAVHAPGKPMMIDPDGGSRFIWKDAPLRLSTDR